MAAARGKAIKLDAIPELPSGLIEAVTNRRVVLFLGAGTSMESSGPKGERPPSAKDLSDRLNRDFLGGTVGNADLMSVADMAIEIAGQSVVFEKIRSMLAPLVPTPAHKLLPTMRWRALVTTNYDELVEKGYQAVQGRLQNVVPIVKNTEPVEELLQNTERPVVLLKIHGCINHAHDEQVPLVLSHEHYALHDRHRSNLYARLNQLAHESTFVFCGYGIGDAHIRNILHRLEADGIKRPTYYIVTPVMEEVQADYWAKKKVTLIKATFGSFMAAIDSRLPEMWRSLDAGQGLRELSVRRHFRTNRDASPALTAALNRDLHHVHASMSAEPQNARRFYEGFDTGWGAILQDLDIHRRVMNDLLSKAIIEEESETEPRLILLRGPAGSGKSVVLKRSAMVASEQFDSLALWLQPDGALRADSILELADLSGKRIYVFVDRAAVHVARIESLLRSAKQKNAPITIVAAERDSEWNAFAPRIAERWKPHEFRLGNLAPREVDDLVTILGKHDSLGLLSTYPRQKQVEAFMKRADRQLLVALHEATRGKPFEDIVFDEYQGISSDRARHLYLDICTLNQFGVSVRAGTISRVAGIRFDDYRRNLFEPLENVVLTNENRYTGDVEYRARHAKVAEFVFQAACPTDEAKGTQLTRMIEHLDVGFEPDRVAVESIAKGRSLSEILSSVSVGREIYAALVSVLPDTAFLYQQWAIFEYTVQGGSLEEAERLAAQARAIDPRSKSAAHTHAEVARRRASAEKSPLLKEQYRRLARQRLNDAGAANDMLVLSSRCKLLVDDVRDYVEAAGGVYDDEAEKVLSDLVREAEREIQKAQQLYHEFADLDETQWRLNVILDEHRKAQRALERAWKKNPRGASVAIRLAKDYLSHDENEKARQILEEALQRFPDDRDVHVAMARFLLRREGELTDQIGDHLARSYRPGDANYDARHLHAQFLFCWGDVKGAQNLFDDVKQRAPGEFRSRSHKPSGDIGRHIPKGVGRIVTKDSTFCFIRSPGYSRDVYANEANSDVAVWENLQSGAQVEFQFAFGREGPVAHGLRPLSG